MNLSALILASLGVGIIFGALLNGFAPDAIAPLDHYLLTPLGRAFLRLIQFVVVPIVFSSLILGLTRVRDAAQVGRYILKLMASYMVTSAIAVCLGLTIATLLQPGNGVSGLSVGVVASVQERPSMIDWLISLIPVNPLQALSTGNLLQTIFSAALIGVGIQLAGEKAASFVSLIESVYVIFEKILSIILYTAPIGVFALISSVIATQGFSVIGRLLLYILGLFLAFSLMMALYVFILFVLKAKPVKFFQSFFPTFSLGFGTASTNAVLPIALQNAEESYGMNEAIASFAIPLGTALKRDGSAIFQGFNALFIAQIFQIPLTTDLLLAIALSTFLVSFSTAGVPGSGIIMMTTVLAAAGLPLEGVAIVAGVDRLIDGFKTILNITGNIVNAVILSRWENSSAPSLDSANPATVNSEQ
jgi:Na+/H+-dicarboxylate symporter